MKIAKHEYERGEWSGVKVVGLERLKCLAIYRCRVNTLSVPGFDLFDLHCSVEQVL